MNHTHYPPHSRHQHKQQGAALLIFVMLMLLAGTGFLFSVLNSNSVKIERDKKTAEALAEAKAALIGWSVSRGGVSYERPGELPCPDTDQPGTLNFGVEQGTCTGGQIGRLPWKTLGIPEPLDGNGEPLWYVIDTNFRKRWGSVSSTNRPINSDTVAALKVYASDGLTLLTTAGSEAVAIIFSAGSPIANQSRTTNAAYCLATTSSIPENKCASNYLDTLGAYSNYTTGGPFISASTTSAYNDKVMFITAPELIKAVEKRVGKEFQMLLESYFIVKNYYPNPAKYNATGCMDTGSLGYLTTCASDVNECHGRFPDMANNGGWSAPNPVMAGWIVFNLWPQVTYYSIADGHLQVATGKCSVLTVNTFPKKWVLILPGSPLNGVGRPTPILSDYLEDAANNDKWNIAADNDYISPSATSNDLLLSM